MTPTKAQSARSTRLTWGQPPSAVLRSEAPLSSATCQLDATGLNDGSYQGSYQGTALAVPFQAIETRALAPAEATQ